MKKDNIGGLEGYYISRLGSLWRRYDKCGKLCKGERREIKFRYECREKICRLGKELKVWRLRIRRIVKGRLRCLNRLV